MEEKVEEGVSLIQIFKVIFSKKKLFGIITGSIFIVLMLFIVLLYNPSSQNYQAQFNYVVAVLNEG